VRARDHTHANACVARIFRIFNHIYGHLRHLPTARNSGRFERVPKG